MAAGALLQQAPCTAAATTGELFRKGMRRLAGAATIITSCLPGEGRCGWVGLTATAVASVTAEPPRLLVCVNRSTFAHGVIERSGVLGVNLLGEDEQDTALRFAGGVAPEERFLAGDWQTPRDGPPLLGSALAAFACSVAECIAASTHDIFICDVRDVLIRERGGEPLIYFDGAFLAGRDAHPPR